jgi:hypothetical protein
MRLPILLVYYDSTSRAWQREHLCGYDTVEEYDLRERLGSDEPLTGETNRNILGCLTRVRP